MLKPAFVLVATLWAGLSCGRPIDARREVEFNTAMMDATIQIGGPSINAGKEMCGSGFCISGPFYFFFSSRRRHTRFDCDWSSDVCSSDLLWRNRLLHA